MRASNVEEVSSHGSGDPWEVFTQLIILIIEGRTPGGEKGFHAGPHCSLSQQAGLSRHVCDQQSPMCVRLESLLRQLRLMWGVGVRVSVEVLVAPECEHGAAFTSTLDTPTAPSPQLKLIEQWNFNIYDRNVLDASPSGWPLVAAVRSFLHFSQLSAWLSISGGSRPPNIIYRLTSPVFCSKFESESVEHTFPTANVGQETAIKVAVRSVPRSSQAPIVVCHEIHPKIDLHSYIHSDPPSSSSTLPFSSVPSSSSNSSSSSLDPLPTHCQTQNVSKSEGNSKAEEDLRRSMMRARLGEPSRVSRSESPDTQLGESLLDPPNSLSRVPRRFQSPSRCGSPSMETPEHIICRVRHPGPSPGRPPELSFCQPLVINTRQPLNAFAWTQTRYPSLPDAYQNPRNPFHNQSIHPEIFHAPSEPLPVGPYHPNKHVFSSHSKDAHPECFYNSNSNVFWPHHGSILVRQKPQSPFVQQYHTEQHSHIPRAHYEGQRDHCEQNPCKLSQETQNQPSYNRENELNISENNLINKSANDRIEFAESGPELSPEYRALSPLLSSPRTPSDSTASSSCNVLKVVNCSDPSISPKSREAQGTKRKGAYNKESPRTKRESPPHVYYSKEGKGIEDMREEAKEREELRKRKKEQDPEEGLGGTRSCSNKRGMVIDQLWSSCTQPGKHLCTSVEDHAEISKDGIQPDYMPNTKSLRKEQNNCCNKIDSCNSKVSFDLTPKETQEVLEVLRHNTPVPPLRISQHKSSSQNQSIETCYTGKTGGLELENSKGGKCIHIIAKSEVTSKARLSDVEALSVCGDPCYKSRGKSDNKMTLRCHREEASKTNKGPDIKGEANTHPTSSNNCCDTSFKKTTDCTCDRKMIKFDGGEWNIDKDEDSDDDVLDGLSQTEIENIKKSQLQIQTSCIEARTVTQKTSYFTANSQPASGSDSILRQTSQALRKSPLTSVLSSMKIDSIQGAKDCTDGKEKVKRVLSFDAVAADQSRQSKADEDCDSKAVSKHGETTSGNEEARNDFMKSVTMLRHLMKKPYLSDEIYFDARKKVIGKVEDAFAKSQDTNGVGLEKSLANGHKADVMANGHKADVMANGHKPIVMSNGHIPAVMANGHKPAVINIENEVKIDETKEKETDKEVEDLCRAKAVPIPSTSEKVKFRRSLDSAATLVFHNKTGLPLTSSPAPLRKGTCFDFDSSLNSIEGIRSAFRASDEVDEDCEAPCKDSSQSLVPVQHFVSVSAPATVTCSNLLGSFEECVLNGRLEPVSTVQGFRAEIAASGVFCPKHTTKPVTVFFYTLSDNDQVSSPYMGHINLGKKGYQVPNKGTVQVTLFNPHGTVVKMFVVVYDLSDMPANSKTFLRQRTLNMPVGESDSHQEAHQWLRYLIHLRFASSKSGKIYLHTDVRMLIFRKSDADAATLHKTNVPYELRSFTNGPSNPKFSPRK